MQKANVDDEPDEDTIMEIANALISTTPPLNPLDDKEVAATAAASESKDVDSFLTKASEAWQGVASASTKTSEQVVNDDDSNNKFKVNKSKLVGGAARESFLSGGFQSKKFGGQGKIIPGGAKKTILPLKGAAFSSGDKLPMDPTSDTALKNSPVLNNLDSSKETKSVLPPPPSVSKGAAERGSQSSPFMKFIKTPYSGDTKKLSGSNTVKLPLKGAASPNKQTVGQKFGNSFLSGLKVPKIAVGGEKRQFVGGSFLKSVKAPVFGDKQNNVVADDVEGSILKGKQSSEPQVGGSGNDVKSAIASKEASPNLKAKGNSFLSGLKLPKGAVVGEKKQFVGSFLKSIKGPNLKIQSSSSDNTGNNIPSKIGGDMSTGFVGLMNRTISKDDSVEVGTPVTDDTVTDVNSVASFDFEEEARLRDEQERWIAEQNRLVQERQKSSLPLITKQPSVQLYGGSGGDSKSAITSKEASPMQKAKGNSLSSGLELPKGAATAEKKQFVGSLLKSVKSYGFGSNPSSNEDASNKTPPDKSSIIDRSSKEATSHYGSIEMGTPDNEDSVTNASGSPSIDFAEETRLREEQERWIAEQNRLVQERQKGNGDISQSEKSNVAPEQLTNVESDKEQPMKSTEFVSPFFASDPGETASAIVDNNVKYDREIDFAKE
eukprot:scaffold316740_cov60-Cyclotella_meneghiniana.AAC.1